MNLADHLRPLLRDHDCVIIPDFGGLVVEYTPAQVRPAGRHLLFPPTRQVAFNQALTRNDGLLVDALRQHLGLGAPEAREAVRQAVATLHQQLRTEQRTELPGIGVFRQLPGRGLQFDYTGTDNLLPAAYGLPELTAHPVRTLDARAAREQQAQLVPRLRSAGRQVRWARLVPGAAIGLLAGVAVATVYLLGLHPDAAPVALRSYLPRFDQVASRPAPQQATLGQPSFAPVPTVRPGANTEPVTELLPAASTATPASAANSTAPGEAATTAAATVPAAATAETAWEASAPATTAVPATATKQPAATLAPAVTKPLAAAPAASPAAAPAEAPAAKPLVKVAAAKALASPARPGTAQALAAAHALGATTTIKRRTGRFYVVVAAYDDLAHAEEGRRRLAKAGRPAKIIFPYFGTRHYRLSAADFPDKATASYTAAKLRHNPNFDKASSVLPY
ncbi:SPOR domain-containing protein [Hymenobacter sp. RP-2-7]|uniref:SPOR domain-containing protein n=1 Tax=Hymenobacter polaris TaxID=2682546 RepID=A0A7Y0ABG1_9BACT|nr:SPOR domain-containing protein [Hymenobacter polaris]NML64252.1 SPOR domain-containing protein [Hymenobacter polaris]